MLPIVCSQHELGIFTHVFPAMSGEADPGRISSSIRLRTKIMPYRQAQGAIVN
jgi:hypothetical protein